MAWWREGDSCRHSSVRWSDVGVVFFAKTFSREESTGTTGAYFYVWVGKVKAEDILFTFALFFSWCVGVSLLSLVLDSVS